jgi:SAM-dependent methyltransferase
MKLLSLLRQIRRSIPLPWRAYVPREYWKERLNKQGASYVGRQGMTRAEVEGQAQRFWFELKQHLPERVHHVLDFGCGVGRLARFLSPVVEQYTGTDINVDAFSLAPQLANVTYVPLNENRLPFADGSFDLILAITVLQHIVDPTEFDTWSRELHRVAKDGCTILIIDNHGPETTASHVRNRLPETIGAALRMDILSSRLIHGERGDSHWMIHGQVRK